MSNAATQHRELHHAVLEPGRLGRPGKPDWRWNARRSSVCRWWRALLRFQN